MLRSVYQNFSQPSLQWKGVICSKGFLPQRKMFHCYRTNDEEPRQRDKTGSSMWHRPGQTRQSQADVKGLIDLWSGHAIIGMVGIFIKTPQSLTKDNLEISNKLLRRRKVNIAELEEAGPISWLAAAGWSFQQGPGRRGLGRG